MFDRVLFVLVAVDINWKSVHAGLSSLTRIFFPISVGLNEKNLISLKYFPAPLYGEGGGIEND